ncbi:MAG: DUF3068 domain-containing protein [Candidatus Nanopelagicales bacterium]
MRRAVGIVLVALGVALLGSAGLFKFYAVPHLSVAPLDLDPSKSSDNSGVATTYFNAATLSEQSNVAVFSNRFTKADLALTVKAGGNNATYVTFTSVIGSDGKPLAAVTPPSTYTFDRTTSVLQAQGSNLNGQPLTAAQVANDTIMPLKFPFWVKQQTYNYFDETLGHAMQMKFVDQEDLQGLTVYKFHGVVPPTQVAIVTDAKGLIKGAPDYAPPLFYSVERTLWVDPVTGQIVNGVDVQKQTLRGPDGTDAIIAFEGSIGYTPANVSSSVAQAKTNAAQLTMLNSTLPLVFTIVGVIAVAGGVWLIVLAYRRRSQPVLVQGSHLTDIDSSST